MPGEGDATIIGVGSHFQVNGTLSDQSMKGEGGGEGRGEGGRKGRGGEREGVRGGEREEREGMGGRGLG